MATPTLNISDGTTTISFFSGVVDGNIVPGFIVKSWYPALAPLKGGGVWSGSPLSDGRSLVMKQNENTIDNFSLSGSFVDQDAAIYNLQELRRLLEKAVAYWATDWQNEPVWIEASGSVETNTRYAIIKNYSALSDPNPFAQPMFSCPSVIDDFPISIEHGAWSNEIPGETSCIETSGGGLRTSYFEFDGAATYVSCGSDASIDNLQLADFTVECWFRADPSDEFKAIGVSIRNLIDKDGWHLSYIKAGDLLQFDVFMTGAPEAHATAKIIPFNNDGEWHHVAGVFEQDNPDATHATAYIYYDGVLIDSDVGGDPTYNDSAVTLIIGADAPAHDDNWLGDIGWMRISDNMRYTANFTPPARCSPPIDANTVAQWHFDAGEGTNLIDYSSNMNDGTITPGDGEWPLPDCIRVLSETCEKEVFVANKDNTAQVEYIYIDDGGVFDAENYRLETTPFELLPAVPVIGDTIYFGSTQGPFCSLVFDIGTVATAGIVLVWEYWDGAAWTAFLTGPVPINQEIYDYTDGFKNSGVNPVNWLQAFNITWDTTAVNGVTGWWIRARTTAVGGAVPTQANREIYTVTWSSFFVDSEEVGGDLPLLVRLKMYARSNLYDNDSGGLVPNSLVAPNIMLLGLRSTSRGEVFQSRLNASDEQNIAGISVTAGVGMFYDNNAASTGRALWYSPVIASGGVAVIFEFTPELAVQFYGRYRAFIVCKRDGGVATDISMWLRIANGDNTKYTERGYITLDSERFVIDVGVINLPLEETSYSGLSDDLPDGFEIDVMYDADTLAADFWVYEVVLIPVDEWAGSFHGTRLWNEYEGDIYADFDSARLFKQPIRAVVRIEESDNFYFAYSPRTSGSIIIQANSDQKFHMFSYQDLEYQNYRFTFVENLFAIELLGVQRYISMRGNR